MKKLKEFVLCLSAMLLFFACSSEDDTMEVKSVITFSPEVSASYGSVGRAMEQGFMEGDQVSVYLYNNNLSSWNRGSQTWVDNLKLTCSSSHQWIPVTPYYWEDAPSSRLGCVAVYPALSEVTEETDLTKIPYTVSSDQRLETTLRKNDLLWASKQNLSADSNADGISLSMERLLCKVTLDLSSRPLDYSDCSVCSAVTSGTLDVVNGEVSANTNGGAKQVHMHYDEETSQAEVFLIPQTLPAGKFLSITYEGRTVYIVSYQPIVLQKGMSYTMSLGNVSGNLDFPTDNQGSTDDNNLDTTGYYTTGSVITYMKNRVVNPVTLVVVGDGFIQSDMAPEGNFEQACRKAADCLFSVEPFKTYRNYFNVYFIAAVSNERGSSNNTTHVKKDTYFGASWRSDYDDMAVKDENQLFNFVSTYCPDIVDGLIGVDNVPVIVLSNDNRYGGITHMQSASNLSYSLVGMATDLAWSGYSSTTSGDWTNVFVHEGGGHAFGRLLDEYGYESYPTYTSSAIDRQSWKYPCGYNLTTDQNNEGGTVYWSHLLNNANYPEVGFYEGGMCYLKGVWRSEYESCMDDNRLYFNAISRQLIVERILKQSGEIFSQEEFYLKDSKEGASSSTSSSITTRAARTLKIYPKLPAPVVH